MVSADNSLPANGRIDASGEDVPFEQSLVDPRLILSQELPVIYGVDLTEIRTDTDHDPDAPGDDISFDVLPDDIKMEILGFADDVPKEFRMGMGGPQILIYHTHTTEAYRPVEGREYVEAGKWHTVDARQSVVAVGEELTKQLKEYGFSVIHDKTNHERSSEGSAYVKSLRTMEANHEKHPALSVFIDVHRDSYDDISAGMKDFVTVNGEQCARVMFVVGTGEKSSYKPNYESNYKLALAMTSELENIKDGFTRPIRVKTSHYNQQVSDMCLLIEVGHNANSLEQAMNTVKYVAKALSCVLEQD